MKLHTGIMKSKELAEWFQVTYNTYSHKIDIFLNKLSDYADFEKVYGGVNIKEIYLEEYNKSFDKQAIILYLRYYDESQTKLMSLAGMARKCQAQGYYTHLSQKQVERILQKAGTFLFGKTNKAHEIINKGEIGLRKYCWAIKIGNLNNYRFMTEEEEKMFNDLTQAFVSNPYYREKTKDRQALIKAYKRGDATKEDVIANAEEEYEDFYTAVLLKFKHETGYILTQATLHEILASIAERQKKQLLLDSEKEIMKDIET